MRHDPYAPVADAYHRVFHSRDLTIRKYGVYIVGWCRSEKHRNWVKRATNAELVAFVGKHLQATCDGCEQVCGRHEMEECGNASDGHFVFCKRCLAPHKVEA